MCLLAHNVVVSTRLNHLWLHVIEVCFFLFCWGLLLGLRHVRYCFRAVILRFFFLSGFIY